MANSRTWRVDRSPVSSLLNSSLSPCQPWRPPLRSSGRKYQPHLTCSKPFLSNTIPMIAATYGSASLLFNNAVSASTKCQQGSKKSGGAGFGRGGRRRTAYPVLHAAFRKQDTPAGRRRRRAPSPAHAGVHWLGSFQTGRCSVPQLAVEGCCWNGDARGAPAPGSAWPATASYSSPNTPGFCAQCRKPKHGPGLHACLPSEHSGSSQRRGLQPGSARSCGRGEGPCAPNATPWSCNC